MSYTPYSPPSSPSSPSGAGPATPNTDRSIRPSGKNVIEFTEYEFAGIVLGGLALLYFIIAAIGCCVAGTSDEKVKENSLNSRERWYCYPRKKAEEKEGSSGAEKAGTSSVTVPNKTAAASSSEKRDDDVEDEETRKKKEIEADHDLAKATLTGTAAAEIFDKYKSIVPMESDKQMFMYYGADTHNVTSNALLIWTFVCVGTILSLYIVSVIIPLVTVILRTRTNDDFSAASLGHIFSFLAVLPLTFPYQKRTMNKTSSSRVGYYFFFVLCTLPCFFSISWVSYHMYFEALRPFILFLDTSAASNSTNRLKYARQVFVFVWCIIVFIVEIVLIIKAAFEQMSEQTFYMAEPACRFFQYGLSVAQWSSHYKTIEHYRDATAPRDSPDFLFEDSFDFMKLVDKYIYVPVLELGHMPYAPKLPTLTIPDDVEGPPTAAAVNIGTALALSVGFVLHLCLILYADYTYDLSKSALWPMRLFLIVVPIFSVYGAIAGFTRWYAGRVLASVRKQNADNFLTSSQFIDIKSADATYALGASFPAAQAASVIMSLFLCFLYSAMFEALINSTFRTGDEPSTVIYWCGYGSSIIQSIAFAGLVARGRSITHPTLASILSPFFYGVSIITALTASTNRLLVAFLSITAAATCPVVSLVPGMQSLDPMYSAFYAMIGCVNEQNNPLLLNSAAWLLAVRELKRLAVLEEKEKKKNDVAAVDDVVGGDRTATGAANSCITLEDIGVETDEEASSDIATTQLSSHPVLRSLVRLHILRLHYESCNDSDGKDLFKVTYKEEEKPAEVAKKGAVDKILTQVKEVCAGLCCSDEKLTVNQDRFQEMKYDMEHPSEIVISPSSLLTNGFTMFSSSPAVQKYNRIRRRWQLFFFLWKFPSLQKQRKHYLYSTTFSVPPKCNNNNNAASSAATTASAVPTSSSAAAATTTATTTSATATSPVPSSTSPARQATTTDNAPDNGSGSTSAIATETEMKEVPSEEKLKKTEEDEKAVEKENNDVEENDNNKPDTEE